MVIVSTPPFLVTLHYADAGALRFDCETQLGAGGLLFEHGLAELPGAPSDPSVAVDVLIGGERLLRITATLVELDDTTIQLELGPSAVAQLTTAVQMRFADVPSDGSSPAIVTLHAAPAAAEGDKLAKTDKVEGHDALDRRIRLMSLGEKIQLALHGAREERAHLVRDRVPTVQAALLRNPKLTLDEVLILARSPHLGGEAAEAIAAHPTYGCSSPVGLALVRNPKTPTPTAIRLLSVLQPSDLRIVAKMTGIRAPVQAAARKKLVG